MDIPPPAKFLPPTAPTITLYSHSSCQSTSTGPSAGYAVFVDHSIYKTSICEPLPGVQTLLHAQLKALCAALELALAFRVQRARVVTESPHVAKAFAEGAAHLTKIGSPDEHALLVQIWRFVDHVKKTFQKRAISVVVTCKAERRDTGMRIAHALAEQACAIHTRCGRCGKRNGRDGSAHRCAMVCEKDGCRGRVFVDAKALESHIKDCHFTKRPCRKKGCERIFGSEEAAVMHERRIHNSLVVSCDFCNAFFKDSRERDEHQAVQCSEPPYCCDCQMWFRSVNAYAHHIRRAHGSQWYY